MNTTEHKQCFGTIFPKPAHLGDNPGKVFSLHIDAPAGMMPTRPAFQTDIEQWDDCQRCPEFESCYRLCMAKLALETNVSTHY